MYVLPTYLLKKYNMRNGNYLKHAYFPSMIKATVYYSHVSGILHFVFIACCNVFDQKKKLIQNNILVHNDSTGNFDLIAFLKTEINFAQAD